MKSIIIHSAVFSLGTAFFIVSCSNQGRTAPSINKNKANDVQEIYASFKSDASVNTNNIEISGSYQNCVGKTADSKWLLTKDSSNIKILKNDDKCKLLVKEIKESDGINSNEFKHNGYEITSSELTALKFVPFKGKAETIYTKMNLFSNNGIPKINILLSRFEKNNIELTIADIDEELTVIAKTFQQALVPLPSVDIENKMSIKAIKKSKNYEISYTGSLNLINKSPDTSYEYLIAQDEQFNNKKNIKLEDIQAFYESEPAENKKTITHGEKIELNKNNLGFKDNFTDELDHSTKKIIIAIHQNGSTSYKMFEFIVSLPITNLELQMSDFIISKDTNSNPYGIKIHDNKLVASIDPLVRLLPDLPVIDVTGKTVCTYTIDNNESDIKTCANDMFNNKFEIDHTKTYQIKIYKGSSVNLNDKVSHFINIQN